MFQRDYILRLIEEFARLMAALAGLKREGKLDEAFIMIDKAYIKLLKLEPKVVKSLNPDELLPFLQNEMDMNNEGLKMTGELLFEEGMIYVEKGDPVSAANVLGKSKMLILHLMEHETTYSFDWHTKLYEINHILGN
jgi:predicted RNA-binding protein